MTNTTEEDFVKLTLDNPWRNVYWFARMLINNDKYGGFGKDINLLANISSQLRLILDDMQITDNDSKVAICKNTIHNILEKRFENSKVLIDRVHLFCEDINYKLNTLKDVKVFILTVESVMIPINHALKNIPNNDREYASATAQAYMEELGDQGLATVINLWDDLGVLGCLNAERAGVVREFTNLKHEIKDLPDNEANLILTAFVQEFERRLGQKRKSRAGGSLEDVLTFLFDFYKIKSENEPEHFQADIEIDKWFSCRDGWIIGISCKRTLRERWKQVSSADRGVLSRYKIKQIWHLITYDEDLSDDKIALLGSLDHIFYLRDDSRKLLNATSNIGLKNYVRPMSQFIKDLLNEQAEKKKTSTTS